MCARRAWSRRLGPCSSFMGQVQLGKRTSSLQIVKKIWQFSTFLWRILHFVATRFGEERFTRHQCVSRRKCHDQRFDWAEALRLSFSASIVSLLKVALTWMPGIAWDIPHHCVGKSMEKLSEHPNPGSCNTDITTDYKVQPPVSSQ